MSENFALAAVEWVEAEIDGKGDDKLAAAKVKVLEQVQIAGYDAAKFKPKDLSFTIETALQAM